MKHAQSDSMWCCTVQDTLESWQLGFDFQEGEVIQTTNDYFDTSNGSLLLPAFANQREVELQSALLPASQQAVAAGVLVPGQVSSQGSACVNAVSLTGSCDCVALASEHINAAMFGMVRPVNTASQNCCRLSSHPHESKLRFLVHLV